MQLSPSWRRNLFAAAVICSICSLAVLYDFKPSHYTRNLSWYLGRTAPANYFRPSVKLSSPGEGSFVPSNTWPAGFSQTGNANFLGPRPSSDQVANLTLIVEKCRGSYSKQESMLRVNDCLDYLANQESDYLFLPYQGKASNGNPLEAPYFNADGQGNTLRTYPTKIPSSEGSIGKCNGPVIPYHAYWSGPATWRVELFIKSYIHTQNVECSRFWLWVDSETNPNAADEMLKDPAFLRFIPLVKRGDVVVKAWKFPNRLRLFLDRDRVDRGLFFILPDAPQSKGESIVADHVIRTQVGEDWLVFGLATSSVLPTAISDAVRFVVLHQYGGVYLDMDGLLLRDLRPLLLSDQAGFAERWGIHFHPSRYNTQTLALRANSSLSSYLLHGGVRMGMNFHPQAIGQMVWKDGRNAPGDPPDKEGFLMLETALFDPLWGELDGFKEGPCMIPCMRHVQDVFRDEIPDEWISLPETDLRNSSQRVRTLDTFVRGAWNYHIHNQWTTKPEPSSWLAVVCAAHDQFLSGQMSNFHGEMWHGPPIQQYDQFR